MKNLMLLVRVIKSLQFVLTIFSNFFVRTRLFDFQLIFQKYSQG